MLAASAGNSIGRVLVYDRNQYPEPAQGDFSDILLEDF